MNEEGFLLAVIAQPDDDLVRLAYADYLEEHGQPDRAEFIRVQIALARLPDSDPRRLELERRQGALFDAHHPGPGKICSLAGPIAHRFGWAGGNNGIPQAEAFRRGLLEVVWLDTSEFLARVEELFGLTPVRGLRLRDCQAGLDRVLARPELRRLRAFHLGAHYGAPQNDRIGGEGARLIARCPHLCGLTQLTLYELGIDDAGAQALAVAEALAGLRELSLGMNRISGEGVRSLAGSPHLTRLTKLNLEENLLETGAARQLAGAGALAGVEVLKLWRNEIEDAGAAALASSPHLSRLVRLDLGDNGVGDAGMLAIVGSDGLAALREVSFWDNGIGDEGAARLAELPGLGRLTYLDLGANGVTARGVESLRRSPYVRGVYEYGSGLGGLEVQSRGRPPDWNRASPAGL